MSYTRQNFVNGQVLTADHMNHIEDGFSSIDYNDLQNKPFYEEIVPNCLLDKTLVDKYMFAVDDRIGGLFYLSTSNTYEVLYNDTRYNNLVVGRGTGEQFYIEEDEGEDGYSYSVRFIGNPDLAELTPTDSVENSDAPFCLIYDSEKEEAHIYVEERATIELYCGTKTAYKPIDYKYLPEALYFGRIEDVRLLYKGEKSEYIWNNDLGGASDHYYTVVINGIKKDYEAQKYEDYENYIWAYYLGNPALLSDEEYSAWIDREDNGELFCWDGNTGVWYWADDVTGEIEVYEHYFHTEEINEEYLPPRRTNHYTPSIENGIIDCTAEELTSVIDEKGYNAIGIWDWDTSTFYKPISIQEQYADGTEYYVIKLFMDDEVKTFTIK